MVPLVGQTINSYSGYSFIHGIMFNPAIYLSFWFRYFIILNPISYYPYKSFSTLLLNTFQVVLWTCLTNVVALFLASRYICLAPIILFSRYSVRFIFLKYGYSFQTFSPFSKINNHYVKERITLLISFMRKRLFSCIFCVRASWWSSG